MAFGRQAIRASVGRLTPAVHRWASDAQNACDSADGLAVVHQVDGTPPSAFEFCGSSDGSAHIQLEAPTTQKDSLSTLASVCRLERLPGRCRTDHVALARLG